MIRLASLALIILCIRIILAEEGVEITLTPQIKAALLEANPHLFGTFDQPTRAACKCRLEPFDLTPYKAKRFRVPATNPQWSEFLKEQQAQGGLNVDQYGRNNQRYSVLDHYSNVRKLSQNTPRAANWRWGTYKNGHQQYQYQYKPYISKGGGKEGSQQKSMFDKFIGSK